MGHGQEVLLCRRATDRAAGGTLYFLHGDHLGSATLTTDGSGQRVGEARYRPYSEMRPGYPVGAMVTDRLYTGQRPDGDTGLLYYGARYYDPALMRFVQADTLVPDPANPQSLNRYAYVLNNPLKYTDPTGYYVYEGGYTDNYDPTRHSYTVPNTAGLIGAEVWFLGPGDAKLLYGTETPMRVAMWSVIATADDPNSLFNQAAFAAGVGFAAAVSRDEGPSGISGIAAPEGIGADPWETGSWSQAPSLGDVARARASRGLPPKVGTEGRTVAVLAADGEVYVGVSGRKDIALPKVNARSRDHAEIDALNQLYLARQQTGITGGHASLAVDQAPCRACGVNGGIRSAVEAVGLESLTVIYPGGSMSVTPRHLPR